MIQTKDKLRRRTLRHLRLRHKVIGNAERPRLCVSRSLANMSAQIVDDTTGRTLVALSTLSPELKKALPKRGNKAAAAAAGKALAEAAKAKGITKVVFDRAGYKYHGRVKALADAAREAGLQF